MSELDLSPIDTPRSLLDAVRSCFTTDDGLPDDLLSRIDKMIERMDAPDAPADDDTPLETGEADARPWTGLLTQPVRAPITGWPARMLQDDSRELSQALSNTPNARQDVRDACAAIAVAQEVAGLTDERILELNREAQDQALTGVHPAIYVVRAALALAAAPTGAAVPALPLMRAAFRTTVADFEGGRKPSYRMVFTFPTIEAMHSADDEWRANPSPAGRVLPNAAVLLAEQVLHMDLATARGQRARELAREVLTQADDMLATLQLIQHATAPTHEDGAHHENAHDMATTCIARVLAATPSPAPRADQPAAPLPPLTAENEQPADAVQAEPEYTIADPELNTLLNASAAMTQGQGNHDIAELFDVSLSAVLARLAPQPTDAPARKTHCDACDTPGACRESGYGHCPKVAQPTDEPQAAVSEVVEPVAPYGWHYFNDGGVSVFHKGPSNKLDADIEAAKAHPKAHHVIPLYTAQPVATQGAQADRDAGWRVTKTHGGSDVLMRPDGARFWFCSDIDSDERSLQAEALRDAERYRWLRENSSRPHVHVEIHGNGAEISDTLDEAIDEAVAKGQSK